MVSLLAQPRFQQVNFALVKHHVPYLAGKFLNNIPTDRHYRYRMLTQRSFLINRISLSFSRSFISSFRTAI